MKEKRLSVLSKRERQIMDIIYMLGEATAADVIQQLPEKVGEHSVRKLIRIVEKKGHLTHRREGRHYVYIPTVPLEDASKMAMSHLLRTFFQYSVPKAVSTLLEVTEGDLSPEDIAELQALVKKAEEEEVK